MNFWNNQLGSKKKGHKNTREIIKKFSIFIKLKKYIIGKTKDSRKEFYLIYFKSI